MEQLTLLQFADEVRQRTLGINSATGKEAERLQIELSAYISENIQAFLQEGLNMSDIQNALRTGTDDLVPQTYAPDGDGNDDGIEMVQPIEVVTYFAPLDEMVIAAFAKNELDGYGLEAVINAQAPESIGDLIGLELVLTDFGRSPEFTEVMEGGEIVADKNGEAFMPERLTMTEHDGGGFHICVPMIYKTAGEVKKLATMLNNIDERMFRKKADIRKLIKSGWLDDYDKRSIKREADNIIAELATQFVLLRKTYLRAAAREMGLVIFVGYCEWDQNAEDQEGY